MSIVLVVDDDAASRGLLREILIHDGHTILEAENGVKALEVLSKEKVDLLITDRSMPTMGGMELLQALAESHSPIPAIVISAFGEESLWSQAIGLGAKDYLLKPFKASEVLTIVNTYLKGDKSK